MSRSTGSIETNPGAFCPGHRPPSTGPLLPPCANWLTVTLPKTASETGTRFDLLETAPPVCNTVMPLGIDGDIEGDKEGHIEGGRQRRRRQTEADGGRRRHREIVRE